MASSFWHRFWEVIDDLSISDERLAFGEWPPKSHPFPKVTKLNQPTRQKWCCFRNWNTKHKRGETLSALWCIEKKSLESCNFWSIPNQCWDHRHVVKVQLIVEISEENVVEIIEKILMLSFLQSSAGPSSHLMPTHFFHATRNSTWNSSARSFEWNLQLSALQFVRKDIWKEISWKGSCYLILQFPPPLE